jgi:nucleotide-binding universal stress UspA family protein
MIPYRRLLLAYDGSEGSRIAAVHAAMLAEKLRAELHAVWVRSRLPHYPETIDEIDEEREAGIEFFEKITITLGRIGSEHGIEIQAEMRSGHPARTIVEVAADLGTDLIIVGNRGHSRLWGGFLGHTADRVSDHAPCSVLIVRSVEETARFRKMLIGYDGSPGAEITVRYALPLAKQLGSEVHVLWIYEGTDRIGNKPKEKSERGLAEQHFGDLLRQINAAAATAGVEVHCAFKIGNAAKSIISEADAGQFRIVALGHRGSSGIWGRLLGGVADRVSEQAHCDVLIVREKKS